MVSILSMAINTAISFFLYILKAVFSMLLWFLKAFVKALKLLFSALPVTALFFIFFLIISLITVVLGNNSLLPSHFEIGGSSFFIASKDAATPLFTQLKDWWVESIHSSRGSLSYVVLLILTLLMFVPVTTVFLCLSALASYGSLLFYAVLLDIAIYLIRTLFGKSFVAQMLDRYYFLFPDAGKRHHEKSYEKWLQRHHSEFEDDTYEDPSIRKKKKVSDFYGDDYEDEDYGPYDEDFYEDENDDEEDFYEDEDNEDDDFYEDEDDRDYERYSDDDSYEGYDEDYKDEEFEDDEDADEDDEDFEGDYDDPSPRTTFDFFAGCTDMDSVEKKYRSLAKLYHPDNMDGDTASFQEINAQYAATKKRFLQ